MYLPPKLRMENIEPVIQMIHDHPFATVITIHNNEPFVSHLPLILQVTEDKLELIGHMSRGNPHYRFLKKAPTSKVIFHGPHAYITPKWYVKNDVPTWNYAVAHLEVKAALIEDEAGIVRCLRLLTEAAKEYTSDQWDFYLPDDLSKPGVVAASIVGFTLGVLDWKAKFKLGQTRSTEDFDRIISGLSRQENPQSRELAKFMIKHRKSLRSKV